MLSRGNTKSIVRGPRTHWARDRSMLHQGRADNRDPGMYLQYYQSWCKITFKFDTPGTSSHFFLTKPATPGAPGPTSTTQGDHRTERKSIRMAPVMNAESAARVSASLTLPYCTFCACESSPVGSHFTYLRSIRPSHSSRRLQFSPPTRCSNVPMQHGMSITPDQVLAVQYQRVVIVPFLPYSTWTWRWL